MVTHRTVCFFFFNLFVFFPATEFPLQAVCFYSDINSAVLPCMGYAPCGASSKIHNLVFVGSLHFYMSVISLQPVMLQLPKAGKCSNVSGLQTTFIPLPEFGVV